MFSNVFLSERTRVRFYVLVYYFPRFAEHKGDRREKALDKSANILYSTTRKHKRNAIVYDGVAQWIERFPAEEEVGGSTPLTIAHIRREAI